ncbi:MAG: hypothetical protein L0Z48_08790, partial [candidate division Zixibacteria bacterium]|nr:hypothetical protein [candidate division Zixibacteria bacterium]
WLTGLLGLQIPRPSGPQESVRSFGPSDKTITQDGVWAENSGWKIESRQRRTVRLFEMDQPGLEQCLITYRLQMKTKDVQKGVYLEMWCLFSIGEYFSKGFHQKAKGTNEWASYQIPFYLKKGQKPAKVKLNLVFEGPRTRSPWIY